MLVIAAPGQGAQTPGFLAPWLELPGVADRLGAWSDLVGCDLIKAGTVGTADEIRDTAVAQPLLVAAALAAAGVLGIGPSLTGEQADGQRRADGPQDPATATGTTPASPPATASASWPPGRSRECSRRRTRSGWSAVAAARWRPPPPSRQTSMTAVLGGDEAAVARSIKAHGLTPANINGAGQIVAAGTAEQLAAFAADPPAGRQAQAACRWPAPSTPRTWRPRPKRCATEAAAVAVQNPVLTVLSNRDGASVRTGSDWLERICGQVSAPVRWDSCMATMSSLGATAFLELPPAGTLVGPGPPGAARDRPARREDARRPRGGQGDARRARPAHRQPRARVAAARRAARRDVPVGGLARAGPGPRCSAAPSLAGSRCAATATWSRPASPPRSSSGWSRTAIR